jgi:rfaE bifunctional protein kinase chain/domain
MNFYKAQLECLKSFPSKHILVIGDVMLDRYIEGDTDRISPEAPIPVVDVKEVRHVLGGAGNVISNLHHLGAKVSYAGVVGDDSDGNIIKQLLAEYTSNSSISRHGNSSTVKTRVISGEQQIVRFDLEYKEKLPEYIETNIIEAIQRIIDNGDINAIIISDYDKTGLTEKIIMDTIYYANKSCIPIFVDPKFKNYEVYKNATYIKPNVKEAEHAVAMKISRRMDNSISICEKIQSMYNTEGILLTLGKEGMLYVGKGSMYHHISECKSIADVSGAGDTVMAIFALCMLFDIDISDVISLCSIGASIVVSRHGTSPVKHDELSLELNKRINKTH